MINRIGGAMSLVELMWRRDAPAYTSVHKKKLIAWWRCLETEVVDHPANSLVAAVSIGVLLGWVIKRH